MIDVRGLSCPEPVILVKRALQKGEAKYEVVADSRVSVENIRKMATFMSYDMQTETKDAAFYLTLERKNG